MPTPGNTGTPPDPGSYLALCWFDAEPHRRHVVLYWNGEKWGPSITSVAYDGKLDVRKWWDLAEFA